jgi:hypothetical protein
MPARGPSGARQVRITEGGEEGEQRRPQALGKVLAG